MATSLNKEKETFHNREARTVVNCQKKTFYTLAELAHTQRVETSLIGGLFNFFLCPPQELIEAKLNAYLAE